MDTIFQVGSVSFAVAAVIISYFFFEYLKVTAKQRFEFKESKAELEGKEASERWHYKAQKDQLDAELTREKARREAAERQAELERRQAELAALREEAAADPEKNEAAQTWVEAELGPVESRIIQLCRYFAVKDIEVRDSAADEDPMENLGDDRDSIRRAYQAASDYALEAHELSGQGFFLGAKRAVTRAKYQADFAYQRIIELDNSAWKCSVLNNS